MSRVLKVLDALGLEIANRRGSRGWALCPFHNDHSPTNFFIRLSGKRAGQSHCFSCKQGGTIIDLVMHVRSCDYESAKAFIEVLGRGYQPPKARVRIVARQPKIMHTRFKMPPLIYYEPLEEWLGSAREYAEDRGLTPEQVDRFRIGYAVDGPLACRIVLPWVRPDGIMVGYSARTFVDADPRYLTPSEKDHADFGTMFGEHLWPAPGERDVLVVTEGGFNALAVLRAIEDFRVDVGAMGGSDINPNHVVKIATFKKVVILTDSDDPGDKAARVLGSMLGRYVTAHRLRLPEKKDALDVGQTYLRGVLLEAFEKLHVTSVLRAS